MRVLHINSYYSTSLFYKNLIDGLNKIGLTNDVYVPVSYRFKVPSFDYGKYTNIHKCYRKNDRYIFHLKHYKILKAIQGEYNISQYDLLHAHSLFSNGYIAYKLHEKFGIPYIVAIRNTDVNTFFHKLIYLRPLGLKIISSAQKVIFISNAYKDYVVDKYIPSRLVDDIHGKSIVIPNGIDDFWFDNLGESKLKPKEKLKLLQVGDINRNKNVTTTLKAVDTLNAQGIRANLTVIGKVENTKLFNAIKLNKHLNYIHPKPRNELIKYYRSHDIFVLPSHKETFGLVYPESMSQGVPVIYSKNQGFDKQFPEGTVGYRVDSKDYMTIVRATKRILNNYEHLSVNCVNEVTKFKWENLTRNYFQIYSSVRKENK